MGGLGLDKTLDEHLISHCLRDVPVATTLPFSHCSLSCIHLLLLLRIVSKVLGEGVISLRDESIVALDVNSVGSLENICRGQRLGRSSKHDVGDNLCLKKVASRCTYVCNEVFVLDA